MSELDPRHSALTLEAVHAAAPAASPHLTAVADAAGQIARHPAVTEFTVEVVLEAPDPRVESLSVHFCSAPCCLGEIFRVVWSSRPLTMSSVRSLLTGLSVAGSRNALPDKPVFSMAPPTRASLHELSRAVEPDKELHDPFAQLATTIVELADQLPVSFAGFYLILQPPESDDVVLHWCSNEACETPPAALRSRSTLPSAARRCDNTACVITR